MQYKLEINETNPAVTVGEQLQLYCLTDVPYHIPIAWNKINSSSIQNISIDAIAGELDEDRYVSVLNVDVPGSYRCIYNKHISKTVVVQQSNSCNPKYLKTQKKYKTENMDFENLEMEYEVRDVHQLLQLLQLMYNLF